MASAARTPTIVIDPRTRTQIVIAVMLGLFLAAIDQTIVGTALPRIVTDLHGNDIYTWAFTGYLLTATISGPIYGKISDLFGRRPVLLFAVIWRTLPSLRRSDAAPRIDYLGASVLVAALVPILIGLTNKQSGAWTDPAVGGLIVAGLVVTAIFVWIESRTADPIVPIELFRNRSFAISVS